MHGFTKGVNVDVSYFLEVNLPYGLSGFWYNMRKLNFGNNF